MGDFEAGVLSVYGPVQIWTGARPDRFKFGQVYIWTDRKGTDAGMDRSIIGLDEPDHRALPAALFEWSVVIWQAAGGAEVQG